MSVVLRWEEPPEAYHRLKTKAPKRTQFWQDLAAELRGQPRRWAVALEDQTFGKAAGISGQIKRGSLVAFRPAGSFEAQTRTTDAGYTLYVRYIGEGS